MGFPEGFIGWIRSCITTPMFSLSVNGRLVGYFHGARTVRQGDPIFPYLFVFAMNVLSKLLNTAVKHEVFAYHPKSKKINLTHLCFTGDLLVFTKGNLESVMGVQKIMKLFYSFFNLQLNCAKSELYSTGIRREDLNTIKHATGFKTGTLPSRYLGVPLVTKRLTDREYSPLIEKITARIKSSSVKLLSYTGRLQLIQSVLFNIQNYWNKHFILPKSVVKRINQL